VVEFFGEKGVEGEEWIEARVADRESAFLG
jgi:hypothetical protein